MNRSLEENIRNKINAAFAVDVLELENESSRHNVPKNAETHFKVTLVSSDFEGIAKVKRHQSLYQLLQAELSSGLHALALHLYTPEEWSERAESAPRSPNCLGGSQQTN